MGADADVESEIQELEKKALSVLEAKRKIMPRRPIVIEFSGTPKSGKSSCISSLDIFLRRNNFKTKILTERASVCPIENKFDPLFNVWNGCSAINQISEIVSNRPKEYDVVIMDRGFFDCLCWFEWQRSNNCLSDEDFKRMSGFFTAPRFRVMVDLVIHFDAEPATSMQREYKNLLTRREGSVMREHVLEGYRESARRATEKHEGLYRQFEVFKTDDMEQNQVGSQVTKIVLGKLLDVFREKIFCVDKLRMKNKFGMRSNLSFSEIGEILDEDRVFEDREHAENDNEKVQIIPVALIKDKNSFSFFVSRKGKSATSPGSPEKDKILLYFGGHVREEDDVQMGVCGAKAESSSSIRILHQCLFRELKEELGIDVNVTDFDPLCIWHRDGGRSEKHMAVIFVVERDLKYTKVNLDDREFVKLTKKDRFGAGSIISAEEIRVNYERLDPWSKEALMCKFQDVPNWHPIRDLLEE